MTKKQILVSESLKVISSYKTKLTLRQLYYRLVSKGTIPNQKSQYQYLSRVLVDARINGEIPWNAIEDRTRDFDIENYEYIDPDEFFDWRYNRLKNSAEDYYLPNWYLQSRLVEVWCEKEALSSLFHSITRNEGVTLGICRGYPSITFLHDASERINEILEDSEYVEEVIILYFGDHDPSGIDIERNIRSRLVETFDTEVTVQRIAITQEQIRQYKIPAMFTKKADARAKKHIAKYGAQSSVELDALDPDVLQSLIRDSIRSYFDYVVYADNITQLTDNKKHLEERVLDTLGNDE